MPRPVAALFIAIVWNGVLGVMEVVRGNWLGALAAGGWLVASIAMLRALRRREWLRAEVGRMFEEFSRALRDARRGEFLRKEDPS